MAPRVRRKLASMTGGRYGFADDFRVILLLPGKRDGTDGTDGTEGVTLATLSTGTAESVGSELRRASVKVVAGEGFEPSTFRL